MNLMENSALSLPYSRTSHLVSYIVVDLDVVIRVSFETSFDSKQPKLKRN